MNAQGEKTSGDLIAHLSRQIVEAVKPKQIVLFGSHARGRVHPESDVDLLVVHDTGQTNRGVRRQLDRLFLDRRFGLDLLVRTPEEVDRNLADGNPFYRHHIFGEGTVIYERAQKEAG